MAIDLHGQVDLTLVGHIDSVDAQASHHASKPSPTSRSRSSTSTCSAAPRACSRTAKASAARASGLTVKMVAPERAPSELRSRCLRTSCGGKGTQAMKKLLPLTRPRLPAWPRRRPRRAIATPLEYDGFIDGSDAIGVSSPSFERPRQNATSTRPPEPSMRRPARRAGRIYKFDAGDARSSPFAELAPSSVIFPQGDNIGGGFAVDNSRTATQGRIYAFAEFAPGQRLQARREAGQQTSTSRPGRRLRRDGRPRRAPLDFDLPLRRLRVPARTAKKPAGASSPTKPNGNRNRQSRSATSRSTRRATSTRPKATRAGTSRNTTRTGYSSTRSAPGLERSSRSTAGTTPSTSTTATWVEKYSSNGSLLDEFATPEPSAAPCPTAIEEAGECYDGIAGSRGIAVDESTGDVYVTNHGYHAQRIDIFKPGPPTIAADVTTDPPVPTPTTALLRGTLNPSGRRDDPLQIRMGRRLLRRLRTRSPLRRGRRLQRLRRPARDRRNHRPHTRQHLPRAPRRRKRKRYVSPADSTGSSPPRANRSSARPSSTSSTPTARGSTPKSTRTTGRPPTASNTGPTPATAPSSRSKKPRAPRAYRPSGSSLKGLDPGTEYHYRVVATNLAGESASADHIFSTFPQVPVLDRQMRQRAFPPADRRGAAAGLPLLRAGLGPRQRRLQRRVRPRPGTGAPRRADRRRAPSLRRPRRRHPGQRQPDQPRRRPLPGGARAKAAGPPGTSEFPPTERLRRRPSRRPCWRPTKPSTPSPSAAPTSALHASRTAPAASRCATETGTGPGHGGRPRPRSPARHPTA